jgi:hypothetical protein
MDDGLIIILIFACVIVAGGLIMILLVILKSSITLKPYKTKDPERDWKIMGTRNAALWAGRNSFDLLSYYTVQFSMRGFMAVWKSKEKPTYLCQYIVGSGFEGIVACEFSTVFENDIGLATANTIDSNLYPKPPGEYKQSFSRCSLDELYKKHGEAEEYLITRGGAQVEKSPIDFEEYFIDSLKKDNRYHWKHWYWIILLFYFFFVRRKRWHNKTIREQHELGMIKLPNEIFLK